LASYNPNCFIYVLNYNNYYKLKKDLTKMIDLLDRDGNPIQLRKLYEDRACPIASDWCYVHSFSEPDETITFAYQDGRIKTFPFARAPEFTKHLQFLNDDLSQRNFDAIRSTVEGLLKMVA